MRQKKHDPVSVAVWMLIGLCCIAWFGFLLLLASAVL